MLISQKIKSIYLYPYTVYKKIENYVMLYYLMLFMLYYNFLQYYNTNNSINYNNIMPRRNNARRRAAKQNSLTIQTNQTNPSSQIVSDCYLVIPNNGQDDGMYNQCMWLSLRDFLRLHGFPYVTVRVLRALAGLDSSTEYVSFDIMKPAFATALYNIARYYNLQIVVFSVKRDGTRSHSGKFIMDPIQGEIYDIDSYIPTEGALTVNIAQYGSSHFELIVSGPNITPIPNAIGTQFVPAVPVKTAIATASGGSNPKAKTMISILRKVSDLTPSERKIANLHLENNKFVLQRIIIEEQLHSAQNKMDGDEKQMHETLHNTDLPHELKKHLVESLTVLTQSNLKIINEYNKQLQRIDMQIFELQTQIFNLEN